MRQGRGRGQRQGGIRDRAMSIGGMVAPLFGMLSDARGLRFSLSVVLCILCVAAAQAWCMRNRRSEGSAAPAAVRA